MILHFLTDDKFADYAVKQFREVNSDSEFICLNTMGCMDLVRSKDTISVMRPLSKEFNAILDDLGKYNAIILHGMHWGTWQEPILRKVPSYVKVAWVLWGGDIYGRHDITENFLAPVTYCVDKWRDIYNRLFRKRNVNSDISWEIPVELYQRVDYCLTSQQEEFDYAKNFTHADFKHLWYTYFSIDEMIGDLKDKRCTGNNIWFGHSATITTNLFDAILQMHRSKHKVGKNQKIIMPLSYGAPWLKTREAKFAKWFFGKRVNILTDFLPRHDYNELMLQCSTMVMPSYVSQGMGNIIAGLWLGMRVYMSERNISYAFLRRIGLQVYSMEKDFSKYGYTPVEDEIVTHNRQIIQDFYGSEHIKNAVRTIVKTLDTK